MMESGDAKDTTTRRFKMGCGHVYVRLVLDDDENPAEVFVTIGKAGRCQAALAQAVARSISIGLRNGVPLKDYVRTLSGIMCTEAQPGLAGERLESCVDGIARMLSEYVED